MQKDSKRYQQSCRALKIGRIVRTRKHSEQRFIHNRFWFKVKIGSKSSCWNWIASKRGGYGRFVLNGKLISATRFVWEQRFGDIPKGLFVCHHCDNPACCNPNHLFLGTQQDNVDDSIKKGRLQRTRARGEHHGMCKRSEQFVKYIRKRYNSGTAGCTMLASETGVPKSTIHHIITGYTWKHIKPASA